MNLFKLLSLATLFQDVTEEVKKSGNEKRPFYLQRSFIGSVIALGAGGIAAYTGINFDQISVDTLSDHITQIVTLAAGVYGTLLTAWGLIMKAVKLAKTDAGKYPPKFDGTGGELPK